VLVKSVDDILELAGAQLSLWQQGIELTHGDIAAEPGQPLDQGVEIGGRVAS
jgi:hypothetical protein